MKIVFDSHGIAGASVKDTRQIYENRPLILAMANNGDAQMTNYLRIIFSQYDENCPIIYVDDSSKEFLTERVYQNYERVILLGHMSENGIPIGDELLNPVEIADYLVKVLSDNTKVIDLIGCSGDYSKSQNMTLAEKVLILLNERGYTDIAVRVLSPNGDSYGTMLTNDREHFLFAQMPIDGDEKKKLSELQAKIRNCSAEEKAIKDYLSKIAWLLHIEYDALISGQDLSSFNDINTSDLKEFFEGLKTKYNWQSEYNDLKYLLNHLDELSKTIRVTYDVVCDCFTESVQIGSLDELMILAGHQLQICRGQDLDESISRKYGRISFGREIGDENVNFQMIAIPIKDIMPDMNQRLTHDPDGCGIS